MKTRTVLLIVALLATVGLYYHFNIDAGEDLVAPESAVTIKRKVHHLPIQAENQIAEKNDMGARHKLVEDLTMIRNKIPPQKSAWIESEKSVYKNLFPQDKYDVLVVPFQSLRMTIDITSRKLMTYRLGAEIEKRSGLTVAPIHLVYKSLGDFGRWYEDDVVFGLANALGVSHIIWGYAGNSMMDKPVLNFSIITQTGDYFSAATPAEHKRWPSIFMGLENLPISAFESRLTEVMEFVGLQSQQNKNASPIIPYQADLEIPKGPMALATSGDTNHVKNSYYLQLMGVLTLNYCGDDFQKDFFIRSLVPLWHIDPASPDYKLLMARAYLYLDRRPLALKVFDNPVTPEGKVFVEYLNANLVKEAEQREKIESPMKRLIAELENYQLEARYVEQKNEPDFDRFADLAPVDWQYLIYNKLNDYDGWDRQSNVHLKDLLDAEFPVDGPTMETLYKGAVAAGEIERKSGEFEMLFVEHIWKALEKNKKDLVSTATTSGPSKYDYLHLLEGIGETNLLKSVLFQRRIQGRADIANQLIDEFLKVFDGHYSFHLSKALILTDIYKKKTGMSDKDTASLVNGIQEHGLKGLLFAGHQQDALSYKYISDILKHLEVRISAKQIRFVDKAVPGISLNLELLLDYPPSKQYLLYSPPFQNDMIQAVPFVHDEFYLFGNIAEKILRIDPKRDKDIAQREKAAKELLSITRNRFRGNGKTYILQAKIAKRTGNYDLIENIYKEGIKESPLSWANYQALGGLYLGHGEYQRAREIFESFPLFGKTETGYNRVGLSNNFYDAGNGFFWQGLTNEARLFYGFSAELDTGSHASLTSQVRMSLMDGDFQTAAAYSQRRARRYNSRYAYRDYMSLLHLMGMSDVAWPLFDSLIGRYDSPQIWTSALVGLRKNGMGQDGFKEWIEERKSLKNSRNTDDLLPRFLVLNFTDRMPSMDDAKLVANFEPLEKTSFKMKESPEVKEYADRMAEFFKLKLVTPEEQNAIHKTQGSLLPFYGAFAECYVQLKSKNYKESFQGFKKISLYYPLLFAGGRQVLPYLIMAGVKSGHDQEVQQFLDQDLIKAGDFDTVLALGLYKGLHGGHDEALEVIKKAFYKRPHTEKRMFFPWYQMLEACEYLYKESDDKRYVDLLLKWAREYQVIQPMFAYGYAFEAKYTDDPERRMQALAFAQYLDRDSSLIAHFSEDQKKKAAKWMERNNPFVQDAETNSTVMSL